MKVLAGNRQELKRVATCSSTDHNHDVIIPESKSIRTMTSQNQSEANPESVLHISISVTSPRGFPSSLLKWKNNCTMNGCQWSPADTHGNFT